MKRKKKPTPPTLLCSTISTYHLCSSSILSVLLQHTAAAAAACAAFKVIVSSWQKRTQSNDDHDVWSLKGCCSLAGASTQYGHTVGFANFYCWLTQRELNRWSNWFLKQCCLFVLFVGSKGTKKKSFNHFKRGKTFQLRAEGPHGNKHHELSLEFQLQKNRYSRWLK